MTVLMKEAHFFSLPSQSTVYGMATLSAQHESTKALIATLRRGVFSLEFRSLIPSSQEVHFTYIPAGAEIIAIDAFNRSSHNFDYVIGITFVKNGNQYLNIYSSDEPRGRWYLTSTCQGCLNIPLNFIPYQLTHARLSGDKDEMVWLMAGSDQNIHLYREDRDFTEKPIEEYFPELAESLPSIVFWLDVHYYSKTSRLTAVGCEDGLVKISNVSLENSGAPTVKFTASIQHDSTIARVCFFTDHGPFPFEDEYTRGDPIHLMVVSTLEVCVVYRDVFNKKLTHQVILPKSNAFDCVTSTLVTDIDMDGTNEILLTTYGQELLTYKWNPAQEVYYLQDRQPFRHPLLSLAHLDFTGDGLKELLVLSTRGLHVLQPDLDAALSLCHDRLSKSIQKMREQH